MSEFVEQQDDEVEALKAIYPEEFESLTSKPTTFKIHLVPNPGGSGENHVGVALLCEFPETYPDTVPVVKIEVEKGLGKKHSEELQELVNTRATENIGTPSIYVLAEAVREWLLDNNIAGQDGSMYAEMTRRMQMKDVKEKKMAEKAAAVAMADSEGVEIAVDPEEEERIRRRQAGTPVTVESFLRWRAAFEEEQAIKSAASGSGGTEKDAQSEQPTGKQLFLSNRAGGLESEDTVIAEAEDLEEVDEEDDDESYEEEDDENEDDEEASS